MPIIANIKRRFLNAAPWLQFAIIAFFAAFFLYPICLAVKEGVMLDGNLSIYWLKTIFSDPYLMGCLTNSFLLALYTSFAVLVISIPLALLTSGRQFAGRNILSGLLLLPLILPPFVGALSVKRFFAQHGTLNRLLAELGIIDITNAYDWLGTGFAAVVILQALHLFPIMYLNLTASLSNLDPMYYEAARSCGSSRLRTFFRITLPLIRPGIFAGGSIVFIWAFTDIGTPLIFDYNELAAVKIFNELKQSNIDGSAYGFVIILLLASVLFYVLGKFIFGKPIKVDSAKASISADTKKLSPIATVFTWLLFIIVIFAAILPHIGVVLTAFSDKWINSVLPESYTIKYIKYAFTQPQTRTSILNSIRYASVSTLIDIALGTTAAWLIVRSKLKGYRLLDGLMMLPLAVPGLILAAGYIALTVIGSPLEKIGPMYNPFWIIVIAYSVRRVPFVVRGVCSGLEQIPESLEMAAANLGAGKLKTIWQITTPLISANIIGAAVLTFSFAMLEVSDSLVLAQQQAHYPITKQMYTTLDASPESINIAAALGVIGMIILGGSMLTASLLMGKRLGAIFRT
ncbi:MAG: ABC transporter permease [Sedimentisphaeraceae bacterium JB056]